MLQFYKRVLAHRRLQPETETRGKQSTKRAEAKLFNTLSTRGLTLQSIIWKKKGAIFNVGGWKSLKEDERTGL